jgi:hypothetical protein
VTGQIIEQAAERHRRQLLEAKLQGGSGLAGSTAAAVAATQSGAADSLADTASVGSADRAAATAGLRKARADDSRARQHAAEHGLNGGGQLTQLQHQRQHYQPRETAALVAQSSELSPSPLAQLQEEDDALLDSDEQHLDPDARQSRQGAGARPQQHAPRLSTHAGHPHNA